MEQLRSFGQLDGRDVRVAHAGPVVVTPVFAVVSRLPIAAAAQTTPADALAEAAGAA